MVEINTEARSQGKIIQLTATLRALGWQIVATDTRGEMITLTIQTPKPPAETSTTISGQGPTAR